MGLQSATVLCFLISIPWSCGITPSHEHVFSLLSEDSELEKEKVAKCLHFGPLGEVDAFLSKFTAPSVFKCWKYCEAVFKCNVLSFNLMDGQCILLPQIPYLKDVSGALKTHAIVIKGCMEEAELLSTPCKNTSEAMSLIKSGKSYVIQGQSTPASCLVKGNLIEEETDSKPAKFALTWRACDKGSQWIMKEVNYTQEISGRPTDMQFYQVALLDEPEICMDVRVWNMNNEYEILKAELTKCHEIALSSAPDSQAIFFVDEPSWRFNTEASRQSLYSSLSIERNNSLLAIVFTTRYLNDFKSLSGLCLRDSEMFEGVNRFTCPLAQFRVLNGNVINKSGSPFFLAGKLL